MSDFGGRRKGVGRQLRRVPEHVRRMPEHMRHESVQRAARASGSVAIWLSVFALVLVCAAVSLGRWWAPVYVENNRQELMEMISEAAGARLHSDDMTLVWSRWGPRLQLTGLSVQGVNGEIPASLERAHFSANVFKWLVLGKLVVDDIEVEGLHLDVLRDRQGKWRLALSNNESPLQDQQGRDWFEVLSRFRWLNLKDSVITFKDLKGQRQYVVDGVSVVANHYDERYRIRIDGDLPPHLGERLKLSADLSGVAGNKLSGQLYLDLEQINLTEFSSAISSDAAQLSGRLDKLQYWQQMTLGKSTNGQLQFAGKDLRVQRPDDEESWAVDVAEVELGWERQEDDWDIWLDNLTFASGGQAWQSGYTRIKRSADGKLQAQGETLRLGSISLLLAQFSRIPTLQALATAAQQFDPRGDLVAWRLLLEPDQQGRFNTAFEGMVSALQIRSVDGRPGVQGLDALVRVRDNQVSARVNSADLRLQLPKVFAQTLHLDAIRGLLTAKLEPEGWWVRSDDLQVEVTDATASAAFEVSQSSDYPGVAVNMRGDFQNVSAAQLPQFYPSEVMNPDLHKWLREGIKSGRVSEGDFVFRGHSAEFPFRQGDGQLRANFAVEGLDLHYSPGWPMLTEVDADMEVSSVGLKVTGSGKFDGAAMEDVSVTIPDYREGRILLDGELQTDGESVRRFARSGPLAGTLSSYFDSLYLSGPMRLKLAPVVALNKGDKSSIEGTVQMQGARVDVRAANVVLRDAVGELPFDQNGLKDGRLEGKIYGRQANVQLKRLANKRGLLIDTRARLAPATWLKSRDNPLADYLSGVGNWRALVSLHSNPKGRQGAVSVSLTSDLRGVELRTPAPVAKAKNQQRPFHIHGNIDAAGASVWDFSLGEGLAGKFGLSAAGDLSSLALGAGTNVPTIPREGVRIRVDWARADAARWYDFIDHCCLQGEGEGSYLDVYATLGEAKWYGIPVGGGSLSMIDDESGLSGRVDSRLANGNFRYNYRSGEEAWDIDLQRVNLTPLIEGESDQAGSEPSAPMDPRTLPITRWKIANLQMSDIKLRSISMNTSPTETGLRLDRLLISNSDYTGNGKGLWQLLEDGRHSSEIDMFLHTNDLGTAVASIGRADAIAGGRGQVTLNLMWQNALYEPDIATMSGDVKLEMLEGRINALDPGAGRLFGLLALQTLPQRLALDFSDLSEGLSYTQVKGEFELAEGLAKTRYLLLEGPIGVINVGGEIDYVNSRFDQSIVVLPNVGGSLPVIGAVVGGPVTAAGVFLADKIFRSIGLDVNRVGRRDYRLTGSFDEPLLEQVIKAPTRAGELSRGSDR